MLFKLIQTRANERCHHFGMKLMMNPSEETWNRLQVYEVTPMCQAYYQLFANRSFKNLAEECEEESSRELLLKLLTLVLTKNILDDGEYFRGILTSGQFSELRHNLARICAELRPDAMAITMLFPQPSILFGALGNEDLDGYERFLQNVRTQPENLERAPWWRAVYQFSNP